MQRARAQASRDSTNGGMATTGAREDPHKMYITMDGAGMGENSGVRVAVGCASTCKMNQSPHHVHTLAMYAARELAESWLTVKVRTAIIWPQLCRIYASGGELLDENGLDSGVFIELVLTADKPALCHVLGRRSFGHNHFSPHCKCCETNNDLYNFSFDKSNHYSDLSFEEHCRLALVLSFSAIPSQGCGCATLTSKSVRLRP